MFIKGIGYFNEELVVALLTHEEGALLVLPNDKTIVIKKNTSYNSIVYEAPEADQTVAERFAMKAQETLARWNDLVDKFLKNSVYKNIQEKRKQWERWYYMEVKKNEDLDKENKSLNEQLELYKAGLVRGDDDT